MSGPDWERYVKLSLGDSSVPSLQQAADAPKRPAQLAHMRGCTGSPPPCRWPLRDIRSDFWKNLGKLQCSSLVLDVIKPYYEEWCCFSLVLPLSFYLSTLVSFFLSDHSQKKAVRTQSSYTASACPVLRSTQMSAIDEWGQPLVALKCWTWMFLRLCYVSLRPT